MFKRLYLLDIIFVIGIIAYSFSVVSFYLSGEYIGTGYEDWMMHAYRIKLLDTFGYTSWVHTWANGIDIWKAYQIIPHVITMGIMNIFAVSATKAMLLVTIFLYIFLRVTMYWCLRLLNFHPLTALFCSLASLDIAQYWGGVSDFTLMFGISIFPLMIYFWTLFTKGKLVYIFPYIVGLSFYFHPVLGYTSGALLVAGIFSSNQQIVSLRTFFQLLIIVVTSSLFWFPVLTKESYIYTVPFLTDQFFLTQVIKNYGYFGTSLFIILTIPLGFIGLFLNNKPERKWANTLFLFASTYLLLVIIAVNYPLPKALSQLQFTRGVTLVAVAYLFVFAVFLEHFLRGKSNFIKALVIILIIPVLIEANAATKLYAPKVTNYIPEPVSSYTGKTIDDAKIWTSSIGTTSYFSPPSYQFPYSYMGHLDSNIISPRISQVIVYKSYPDGIVPASNVSRILEYFKITGTKYAFFYQGSPYTAALTDKSRSLGFIDLGFVRSYDTLYHAFQSPVEPIQAAVLSQEMAKKIFAFPKGLSIATAHEQMIIDENVEAFNKIIYNKDNTKLAVSYPYNDTVTVKIPANRSSNNIYLAESYDVNWSGTFNNQSVSIRQAGPNYMEVVLPDGKQDGQLQLKRNYPIYLIIFPFLVVFTGILVLLFTHLMKRFNKNEK